MKNENKRKITRNEYLAALGLFIVARTSYKDSRALETECNEILGLEDGLSHVSDHVYNDEQPDHQKAFDLALKRDGIEVERPVSRKKK